MAAPMSPDTFLQMLLAEGLQVVEEGNWRTHNRNHKGPWGPVNGVMIHHTVTKGTTATVRIVRDGYEDLPGPLCHGMVAKDGRVHLIGYGRTNHAGKGDGDVLAAVIAEKPLPPDNEADTDGNPHFYGFECENLGDGKDPWPDAQLEAIERVSAAICRHHGWTARSVIGHREWQPGKVDPLGFSMADMRDRVNARLAHPASPKGSANPPTKEDYMDPIDVWKYRNARQDEASQKAGHRIPDAYGYLQTTAADTAATRAEVAQLRADVAKLTEAVNALAKGGR